MDHDHLAPGVGQPGQVDPVVVTGLDEIALTLEHEDAIAAFEAGHDTQS